ncbi:MAG: sulfurtransferase [Solirubrobacterales bacterium]
MMMRIIAAALFTVVAAFPALAASPLVDVNWLKANLGHEGLVVLDVRAPQEYQAGHIPGAVNTDYVKGGWRVDREIDKVPEMLPADLTPLARHVGELGIGDGTHVVLVHSGRSPAEVGNATRVYWTLKVMGHDELSILDGGMAAWMKDKANPVEAARVEAKARTFTLRPRADLLASEDDVAKAAASGVELVDSRSEDNFVGINKSPKSKEAGTVPGAVNLPFTWLVDGGTFRTKAQIEALAAYAKVSLTRPQIEFCNTGHLGSIGWFVASELMGNKAARLYDGSMTEWTIHGRPVEQRVKLP